MRKTGKGKPSKTARAKARTAKKPAKVSPLPKGYAAVTPYLIVAGADGAIDFYKEAFGAKERLRMAHDGKVGHAELVIGGSVVMLADEWPDFEARGPRAIGGTPVSIHLYVKNVDATVERAVAAGAVIKRPIENQFYGDRTATLEDPYGHKWHVATHVEDVPPRELRRRADEAFKKRQENKAADA
jgi:PhnB protein